ncbi:acetate--CoA ligase family protein [Bacillus sp. FJAT-29953]|nr:acetate--CoA ligase family protein [Bacillus sp. FJAT-29953]
MASQKSLEALFQPKSIAIIGASPDSNKLGGRPLNYLQRNGYKGQIFPINPNYNEISGLKCYSSLLDIVEDIDLAIISLPSKLVVNVLKQCAEKGVKAAVIFSSGFSEIGEEGRKLQEEMTAISKKSGIRILGPNTLGMFNLKSEVFATFSTILEKQTPLKGNIGFVSQSGAFGSHVFTLARQNFIGFSHFVATGNESDIDVADCIEFLAEDPDTDVIACYMEGIKDGNKLINAFKLAAEKKKPVIAFKVGKTNAGQRAALSHTGSLAGSDQVFNAIAKQYGVYRAETIEEFIDAAYACSMLPLPKGDKAAVFTVSGGVGILLADQLTEASLTVPEPSVEVQQQLSDLLPIAGVKNPIDTTAQLNTRQNLLQDFMEIVLSSGEYDSAIVFLAFGGLYPEHAQNHIRSISNIAGKYKETPIITVSLNSEASKKSFMEKRLAVIEDPSRAVNAMKALKYFSQFYKEEFETARFDGMNGVSFDNLPSVLTEHKSKEILKHIGIPITKEQLAATLAEAKIMAREIGYPVALKGMSPQILHKSDKGLVQLNITNEEELEEKFSFIKQQISLTEKAEYEGILVQEMLSKDSVEMFIGANQDPVFGQMILVGLGGIHIEVYKDAVMRKAPISEETAEEMLDELRSKALLKGFRGSAPRDLKALSRVVAKFSQFISTHDEIEEIDLNPIMVHAEGEGVTVADALITLKNKALSNIQ